MTNYTTDVVLCGEQPPYGKPWAPLEPRLDLELEFSPHISLKSKVLFKKNACILVLKVGQF